MKWLLVFTTGYFAVAASVVANKDSRINGENGWYVPHENGTFYWMDKETFESYAEAMENNKLNKMTLTPVNFYLYTKSNPTKGKQIADSADAIGNSNFNPVHPTKFVIHGFVQGLWSRMNKDIIKAILNRGECNVIVVDWGRARSPDYVSSVLAVPKVGEKVASMIDYLVLRHGMSLETMTLIGHSLGAHVAGIASKKMTTGKVKLIYGLDPALPLFDYSKPDRRLNSDDAEYVETIQTNSDQFGFLLPIGKTTFYPNGGKSQPGCHTRICSHERSIYYFTESIDFDNFASVKCENVESVFSNTCGKTYSSVRMGSDQNAFTASGVYIVPVNKKSPFGILPTN